MSETIVGDAEAIKRLADRIIANAGQEPPLDLPLDLPDYDHSYWKFVRDFIRADDAVRFVGRSQELSGKAGKLVIGKDAVVVIPAGETLKVTTLRNDGVLEIHGQLRAQQVLNTPAGSVRGINGGSVTILNAGHSGPDIARDPLAFGVAFVNLGHCDIDGGQTLSQFYVDGDIEAGAEWLEIAGVIQSTDRHAPAGTPGIEPGDVIALGTTEPGTQEERQSEMFTVLETTEPDANGRYRIRLDQPVMHPRFTDHTTADGKIALAAIPEAAPSHQFMLNPVVVKLSRGFHFAAEEIGEIVEPWRRPFIFHYGTGRHAYTEAVGYGRTTASEISVRPLDERYIGAEPFANRRARDAITVHKSSEMVVEGNALWGPLSAGRSTGSPGAAIGVYDGLPVIKNNVAFNVAAGIVEHTNWEASRISENCVMMAWGSDPYGKDIWWKHQGSDDPETPEREWLGGYADADYGRSGEAYRLSRAGLKLRNIGIDCSLYAIEMSRGGESDDTTAGAPYDAIPHGLAIGGYRPNIWQEDPPLHLVGVYAIACLEGIHVNRAGAIRNHDFQSFLDDMVFWNCKGRPILGIGYTDNYRARSLVILGPRNVSGVVGLSLGPAAYRQTVIGARILRVDEPINVNYASPQLKLEDPLYRFVNCIFDRDRSPTLRAEDIIDMQEPIDTAVTAELFVEAFVSGSTYPTLTGTVTDALGSYDYNLGRMRITPAMLYGAMSAVGLDHDPDTGNAYIQVEVAIQSRLDPSRDHKTVIIPVRTNFTNPYPRQSWKDENGDVIHKVNENSPTIQSLIEDAAAKGVTINLV